MKSTICWFVGVVGLLTAIPIGGNAQASNGLCLRHNLFFALIPPACQHALDKAQKKMADFDEIDHLLVCRGGGIRTHDPLLPKQVR